MSGGKRRAPPKAEKLVDHHLGIVKDAAGKYQGHPLILMGKSMGSGNFGWTMLLFVSSFVHIFSLSSTFEYF